MVIAQEFYLSHLNVSIDASSAIFTGVDTTAFTGDAIAEVDVSYSVLSNYFQYSTDSSSIDNDISNDIRYKVVHTDTPKPFGIDLHTNTTVTVNSINPNATNNKVTHDYISHLALKLFSTYNGLDLIDNEEEHCDHLNSTFKTNLNNVLIDLSNNGVEYGNSNSPSEAILKQLHKNDTNRFADITIHNVGGTWHRMPFIQNDNIHFLLTISAAQNQHQLTGVSEIPDRSYQVIMNLVSD